VLLRAILKNYETHMNPPDTVTAKAGNLVKQLIKTIKSFALYPENNPIYRQGLETLMNAFNEFFAFSDELRIKVEQYQLLYEEEVIFEEKPSEENFAFIFFNDGIQRMNFTTGLALEEIKELISIISDARVYGLENYDIVTSIWERNFPNIHFIASDEGLFQEYETIPGDYEEILGQIVRFGPEEGGGDEEGENGDDSDAEEEEEPTAGGGGLAAYEENGEGEDEDATPLITDRAVAELTEVERDYLDRLIERESARDVNAIMTELIIETTWNETDKEHFPRLVKVLEEQFHECFTAAKAHLLRSILEDLKKMRATCTEAHPWKAPLLDDVAARLGDEKLLTKIDQHISKFDPVELRKVLATVATMRKGNIASLCKTLGRTESRLYRRIICETLADLGPGAVVEMSPFLKDHRWFLVRNILFIMGRIGGEEAQGAIKTKLSHRERRVRREAVNALLQDEQIDVDSLFSLLDDEDKTIRLTVLSSLFKNKNPRRVCEALKKRVEQKDFSLKGQDEINRIFEALGDNGDSHLIPFLKPLLLKKRFFRRARYDKLRIGSALALKRLGSEEARALLLTGNRKGPAAARRACREALRKP